MPMTSFNTNDLPAKATSVLTFKNAIPNKDKPRHLVHKIFKKFYNFYNFCFVKNLNKI
jgi:hypothetical protein